MATMSGESLSGASTPRTIGTDTSSSDTKEPTQGHHNAPTPGLQSPDPVAIVGMACRLPGDVSDPSDLWTLLEEKRTGYKDFDRSRFNIDAYYHPTGQRPGSINTRGGCLINEDTRLFDHTFFHLKPSETLTLDPLQRKLLEVTYEAFENSGEPWDAFAGSCTGVFVGSFGTDYVTSQMLDMDFALPYTATGASKTILSNRINHVFDLRGPSLTVDTACASSIYALHAAVSAIRNGECDGAIVAGCNLIQAPEMQQFVGVLGALSGSSTCHTFDAAADGYSRSEGICAVYLRRYQDAISGRYPVRAVIRGTAVNSNGRTAGITHPSADGQEALIRQAYNNAQLTPDMTGYVECHGTGTPVGDPIEVSAVGRVFSPFQQDDARLLIGSVKTNLGHSESASGLTGIMKAVLCLEKEEIPATVGVKNFNPNIDFDKSKVKVVTKMTPWPKDRLKRASVNSFGYGGSNGHCILDHPELMNAKLAPFASSSRRLVLLPFSAHDEAALSANVVALQNIISSLHLFDVSYTLCSRRSRFSNRAYAIIDTASSIEIPRVLTPTSKTSVNQTSRIGFVFTGQGAQWQAMGSTLFEYLEFRASIHAQDAVLTSLLAVPKPEWTIEGVLTGESTVSIQDPEISQTVCTALQVALVDLLRTWSITPEGTIGHSSGEIAAAYAAGRISRAEAIVIAYCRGRAVLENKQNGAMLAVGMCFDDALAHLDDAEKSRIKVAAINSPDSTTLSGDADAIRTLAKRLQNEGSFARILKTGGNAYHSHHMTPIGERYEDLLQAALSEVKTSGSDFRHSNCRWVSSVTPFKAAVVQPGYWRQNLESPVRFSEAAEILLTDTNEHLDILIEIGPHSALQGPLKRNTAIAAAGYGVPVPVYLSVLKRFADGVQNLLELSGSLFVLNHAVDLAAVNAIDCVDTVGNHSLVYGRVCVAMPTYRYSYGPILYHEPRLARERRQRTNLCHDLLGVSGVGSSKDRPFWRNLLRHKDLPWLSHHRLLPNAVLPGAAYVCAAMEAARQFVTERNGLPERYCFYLRNVRIHAALQIPDDEFGVEMVTNLQASSTSEGWLEFNISSVDKDGTKWTENASGLISIKTPSKKPLCRLNGSISPRRVDAQNWYVEFERIGLGYGKGFQCLSEIDSDPYKHLASARLQLKSTKDMFRGPESSYPIHPASLDACFQLAIIAIHGGQTGRMKHGFIPVSIDDLTVWPQADGSEDWAQTVCHTRMEGPRTARAQIQVLTPSGLPRVELSNLKAVSYYGGIDRTVAPESSEYSRLVWKPDIRTLTTENARRLLTSSNMTSTGDLFSQFLQIVDLASHRSPSMSVMEINGGSSMTEATLRTLGGDCNNKRYASYTVTNTSAEKLGKSENDLRLFKDVEHRVFDPSKRPTDQGFNTKFDYVLASAVSDLTPLATVLGNLRSLLKVGGRLVLMRCGSLDCFRGYLSGFGGVDLCLTSSKPLGNLMVATATEEKFNTSAAPTSTPQTVYIVHDHEPTPLAPVLEECLRSTGLSPLSLSLSNASTVLDNSRVIFTVDLEQKGLFDISESSFYQLKDIMMRCSSILWLTRDSPIASNVPAAALATGFIRTLPKERPEANFGIMHLDLKSTKTGKEELATFIAQQEAQIYLGTGELEYAIHDGVGYIPRQVFDDGLNARFRAINTPSTELVDVRMDEQEPAVVDFGTPGLIGSAHFKRDDLVVDPLKDDWIEIKVAAIGLTEKDIGADDGLTDVAGIVIKCGAGVSCFRPGNRVYALACSRLNTYVRVPASIAQPMASDDTFQNMASVPSAFCSAWYAFSHIAQVKKGQRIFIQSPTSNLGLAAIQVATALGAQIFVSVQTSVQAQYLQKNFAIPEENVFTISQTWDFAEKLLDLTRGTGFETIFSTTADDLNVSIGNCLAPRGLFIHVGKLNVQHRRSVALEILDRNATLSSFDLYTLSVQDLAFCSQLMEKVGTMFRSGAIRPFFSIHIHPISQLTQALRSLSKPDRIGKLVLDFEDTRETVRMLPTAPRPCFDPNAEYILVGGLGGLGISILQWWVLRGARHITVWSRSGSSTSQANRLADDMRLQGVNIHVRKCDVTSRTQVGEAMREASARHTIKGILNTAVTYADSPFVSLRYEQWKTGLSAKVQGSINLHDLSIEQDLALDLFVMTSSVDGLLALPTTATYCAANCFQDALARHRRSIGLPACAIGFGLITEVTEVATMEQVLSNQRNNQLYQTDEFTFLQQVEAAFLPDPVADDGSHCFDHLASAQIMTGLEPTKLAGAYRAGESPMWRGEDRVSHIARAMFDHLSASSKVQVEPSEDKAFKVTAPVHTAVQAGKTQAANDLVITILVQRIAALLMIPIESIVTTKSVAHYGVDSLVAVELRSWMLFMFEFAVPLLKLLDESVSIEELAGAVVENLFAKGV